MISVNVDSSSFLPPSTVQAVTVTSGHHLDKRLWLLFEIRHAGLLLLLLLSKLQNLLLQLPLSHLLIVLYRSHKFVLLLELLFLLFLQQ